MPWSRRRRLKRALLKPLTSSRGAMPRWLARAALYGAAAALLWGGVVQHRRLEATAARALDALHDPLQVHEGRLERDGLRLGLVESGSSAEEAAQVLGAVYSSLKRAATRPEPGDSYRIVRSSDGTLHHVTLRLGRRQAVASRGQDGRFQVAASEIPLRTVQRRARGALKSSLWESMAEQSVPAEIILKFSDVFQWTVDFLTEPRGGDTYAVVWTEQVSPDGRVWGREIEAALYDGERTGRQTGFYFAGDYFDEKGEALQRMFLRAPLNYRRISSYFSRSRRHPILAKRRPHNGIDYAAPYGTPIVAVGGGVVTAVGRKGGLGNRVEVRHNSTYLTLYGHLQRYAPGIRPGVRVRQGQLIGYVGSTGLATGPHLHFQISKNGQWVDFLRLKLPRAGTVQKASQPEFFALRERLLALLTDGVQVASGNGR